MTFQVSYDGFLAGFAPQVSFDGGATFYEQTRFGCGASCAVVTVPILGEYYRFSPGSPVSVQTQVTLNPEPDAKVVLLGKIVSYPFTSESFTTDGFSTITVTIGPGANPQNVTAYTLQRLEDGNWVEKERVGCDGGATCPLEALPVLGGDYKVMLEGIGIEAVVGGILR